MGYTVSHFGFLPQNPDTFVENSSYGPGSLRPIGFTFDEIFKMYWTVRSFQCSYLGIVQGSPLDDFLGAGGAAGIIGAMSALNNANVLNSSGDYGNGYTKIATSFSQKRRKGKRDISGEDIDIRTFEGVVGGKTQKLIKPNNSSPDYKTVQSSVYEGTLFSCGPIHSLTRGTDFALIIDFSSIKYYRRLYYPIIQITSTNFTSISASGLGAVIGGVQFGGGIIPMFYTGGDYLSQKVVNGYIAPGNRCLDRFYYDDITTQKLKDDKACSGWENVPDVPKEN